MYQCDDCGHLFPEPKPRPVWEAGERMVDEHVCPSCGGTEHTEVFLCRECNKWFTEEEMDREIENQCFQCVQGTRRWAKGTLLPLCSTTQREVIEYDLQIVR